ncbi:MAG TPA: carboxypeptidase-like regulatory domain-containing protein [Pyrinomonadaceae bacterium]|nr:carboxypeptidase-like regulatory domain-containing protein [Pyrinomonadaceae bacterium]
MNLNRLMSAFLLTALLAAAYGAQDRATGSIKGKVRLESGSAAAGVNVIAQQGEREVKRAVTDRKGEFNIAGLAPGIYSLTFRKPGLSVGTVENIEVRAGKVRELRDRLYLSIDEGSLAFIRGSVFNPAGRSVPGVRVELARVEADGTAKKIDGRMTNETGSFVFRLVPDAAKYRITIKADGAEPAAKDVEVDGAAVYRIALTLTPALK